MSFILMETRSCSLARSRSPIGAGECSWRPTLRYGRSFEPAHLRSVGRTYRFVNVDADVAVPSFFAVASYAPLEIQALLVRYWETHGRPKTIAIAPGDSTATASIEYLGEARLAVTGNALVLRRFSIQRRRVGARDLVSRPRITVRRHRHAGELAAARRRARGSRLRRIRRYSTRSKRTPHAPSLRAAARQRRRQFQSSPTRASRSSVRALSTERRARRSRMAR